MIPEQYVWLTWASAFLVPWALLFIKFPDYRRPMLWASLFTMPFGLTEPLFVPEYWLPPSLFDLAVTTGFDIESLIFCFGIGGVGAVLYNLLTRRRPHSLPIEVRDRHRYHRWALAAPFIVFLPLYWLPWKPIYPAIVALVVGTVATVICRPDLFGRTFVGGGLFLAYYTVFLLGLELTAPGYIERVWNLEALSGWLIAGFPVEEFLFAATFGAYWSGVYEHYTWKDAAPMTHADSGKHTS